MECGGRAYPNVQNLFGELGIDDRLQVRMFTRRNTIIQRLVLYCAKQGV